MPIDKASYAVYNKIRTKNQNKKEKLQGIFTADLIILQ